MTHDLIIFDCDGTLVDSELLCNSALVEILNECGVTQYNIDHAMQHWVGKTLSDVLGEVGAEQGRDFPADIGKRYIAKCNARYKTDLRPIDGALDLVGACSGQTKICVGSNGQRDNVIQSLTLCGFSPAYFTEENIFTKIQVSVGKPAPELFLFAASNMNGDPAKTLVIEDSLSGVQAGVCGGYGSLGLYGRFPSP